MNAKKCIAATALLLIGSSVFANDLLSFTEADQFRSTKTRAEVKEEVRQSIRSGHVMTHGDLMQAKHCAVSKKSGTSTGVANKKANSAKNQQLGTDRTLGG